MCCSCGTAASCLELGKCRGTGSLACHTTPALLLSAPSASAAQRSFQSCTCFPPQRPASPHAAPAHTCTTHHNPNQPPFTLRCCLPASHLVLKRPAPEVHPAVGHLALCHVRQSPARRSRHQPPVSLGGKESGGESGSWGRGVARQGNGRQAGRAAQCPSMECLAAAAPTGQHPLTGPHPETHLAPPALDVLQEAHGVCCAAL